MNLTVNGQSQVPPGFRFHPTEEELLLYYLKKKVANQKIDLDVIQDVDLNKLEPWDIQEKCRIGSSAQNDWYIFSHKDKKYPTGTRTNRATAAGFWKATGRDKVVRSSSRPIGMRKTLVFYMGRAPHGEKSDWIMHEYRLDDIPLVHNVSSSGGDQYSSAMEEGWVICRVFKKKNYVKAIDSPIECKTTSMSYVASSTSLQDMDWVDQEGFQHLPQLESLNDHVQDPMPNNDNRQSVFDCASYKHDHQASPANWVELDRLVACQLNGDFDNTCHPINHFTDDNEGLDEHSTSPTTSFQQLLRSQSPAEDQLYWSFARQSSTAPF